VGFADAGPPGARPPGRRGGDDRAAGAGHRHGVGMAIAEKHLAAVYNRPGFDVVNHHTYAMLGDGRPDGRSLARGCFAGRNAGSGQADFSYATTRFRWMADQPEYTEDPLERFAAYHWHVQRVADGNDLAALEAAIEAAKAETGSLDHRRAHNHRLRQSQGRQQQVAWRAAGRGGRRGDQEVLWLSGGSELCGSRCGARKLAQGGGPRCELGGRVEEALRGLPVANPELAELFERAQKGELKADWEKAIPSFPVGKAIATRNAGGTVMNAIAGQVPELFGGAADLTSSTKRSSNRAPTSTKTRTGATSFWRARVWNVRGGERDCRPRRADSLWIYLLCLLRLCEARHPAGRADAGAFTVRLYT